MYYGVIKSMGDAAIFWTYLELQHEKVSRDKSNIEFKLNNVNVLKLGANLVAMRSTSDFCQGQFSFYCML